MKNSHGFVVLLILFLLLVSLACQLTSPTPASWAGTPTAQARIATNAALLKTGEALSAIETEIIFTPTPNVPQTTRTPTPALPVDGPWLVYPAPGDGGIHAYDLEAKQMLVIELPQPVIFSDLTRGMSPDGKTLVLRAGSTDKIDELALYRIDLSLMDVSKISPLMSITLQRKIVNNEGTRAFETFDAITRDDGIAWSPSGRFLAFTAALDNESSDLYVYDQLNDRVERLNGLYTHNASPSWSPGSNWLISQELSKDGSDVGWRAENVTGLQIPGYDAQNSLYLPPSDSKGEVFVGWINPQSFMAYSHTSIGASTLKQVDVQTQRSTIVFDGLFDKVVFDQLSQTLAVTVNNDQAAAKGMVAGVYLHQPESASFRLQRAGEWQDLSWDPVGRFIAAGSQGAFVFAPTGSNMLFEGERNIRLSPAENWLLAWGDGSASAAGLRLYQPASDHPLQTITAAQVQNVYWAPDSKSFFVQSAGSLYHLVFPILVMNEVETGFSESEPIDLLWVD